jgi:transposase-like protein
VGLPLEATVALCTSCRYRHEVHKRRNVADHLPDDLARSVNWRLSSAFNHPDAAKGLDAARPLAAELRDDHPDAAASLLEGLEDMFTVRRLGLNGRLALTLTHTNCIESMISVARTTMGRVSAGRTAR